MTHDYDFYLSKYNSQRGINKIWEYVVCNYRGEDRPSYKGSNTLLSRDGKETSKLIERYYGETERPCPLFVREYDSIFLFNIGNTIQAKNIYRKLIKYTEVI